MYDFLIPSFPQHITRVDHTPFAVLISSQHFVGPPKLEHLQIDDTMDNVKVKAEIKRLCLSPKPSLSSCTAS